MGYLIEHAQVCAGLEVLQFRFADKFQFIAVGVWGGFNRALSGVLLVVRDSQVVLRARGGLKTHPTGPVNREAPGCEIKVEGRRASVMLEACLWHDPPLGAALWTGLV
ncbi:hypothetical protein [Antarctobacter sp.]|uniref:hypothetical protein n=1 Tax=Antarctobacter sp. TaxID=1872577 RepID=UPI002B27390E|nr:hypothetical protein [Antarctobacter sp.]